MRFLIIHPVKKGLFGKTPDIKDLIKFLQKGIYNIKRKKTFIIENWNGDFYYVYEITKRCKKEKK